MPEIDRMRRQDSRRIGVIGVIEGGKGTDGRLFASGEAMGAGVIPRALHT